MNIKFGELFPQSELGELREDEYTDEKGFPYCKKCNTKRFFLYDYGNGTVAVVRVKCKCQQEEDKVREKEETRLKNLAKFRDGQKCSMLGKKYLDARFSNAEITEHNKSAYEKCQNYTKNSGEMLSENIGLYLYGDNSSGKSHLLACMCNELVAQGYNCIYTSVPRMIAEIQSSYSDDTAMGLAQLTNMLESKSFVFVDDLGKEFLGREYSAGAGKFAERVLLEILNTRYNNGRPIIFSSNYSIGELAEAFSLDKAIIERINEMSTRVIRLEGDDFRAKALQQKSEIAKKYGI